MSVQVAADGSTPARSFNAGFDLQGTPVSGRLNLSSPLGSVLAQARWTRQQASLTTSEGERDFTNLEDLTKEMLGESLPMAALFDWLRGRPSPNAPDQPSSPPIPSGFQQSGWSIDTSRFQDGWIVARRLHAPMVTVKARIEH